MTYLNESFYKITGTFAASQFPDIEAQLVRLKAPSTNAGSIFIGNSAATTWWEMDAGDDTGWIYTANLNRYWQSLSSGSTDCLIAWVQR
jgi:hypothetical protein